MIYKLRFHEAAVKEWKKLDQTLKAQFKKKIAERLQNPRIQSATLFGMRDCYKIKLSKIGYRLIYRVEDDIVFVTVLSVGKRDKLAAYKSAKNRLL